MRMECNFTWTWHLILFANGIVLKCVSNVLFRMTFISLLITRSNVVAAWDCGVVVVYKVTKSLRTLSHMHYIRTFVLIVPFFHNRLSSHRNFEEMLNDRELLGNGGALGKLPLLGPCSFEEALSKQSADLPKTYLNRCNNIHSYVDLFTSIVWRLRRRRIVLAHS